MKIGVIDGRLLELLKSNLKSDVKYYSKSVIALFSDVCLVDLSENQYKSYSEYDGVDYNVTRVYSKRDVIVDRMIKLQLKRVWL